MSEPVISYLVDVTVRIEAPDPDTAWRTVTHLSRRLEPRCAVTHVSEPNEEE